MTASPQAPDPSLRRRRQSSLLPLRLLSPPNPRPSPLGFGGQTAEYQRLERENGYGSGVLIPDGTTENRGESATTADATADAATPYYIFDGIDPITATLVNTFSARLAMQNFLHDVRERPFHTYDFTHPLFKDNGHGGLLRGFDVRKAWKQHKIVSLLGTK